MGETRRELQELLETLRAELEGEIERRKFLETRNGLLEEENRRLTEGLRLLSERYAKLAAYIRTLRDYTRRHG